MLEIRSQTKHVAVCLQGAFCVHGVRSSLEGGMLRVPWEHEEWGQDRGTKGGWKGSQIEDMTDMKAKHFLD